MRDPALANGEHPVRRKLAEEQMNGLQLLGVLPTREDYIVQAEGEIEETEIRDRIFEIESDLVTEVN